MRNVFLVAGMLLAATGSAMAANKVPPPVTPQAMVTTPAVASANKGLQGPLSNTPLPVLTKITGVTVASDWYDYLKQNATISIKGAGKYECYWQVEFKNNTNNSSVAWPIYTPDAVHTPLPDQYGGIQVNLTPGDYTITVRPNANFHIFDQNIVACTGQASVNAHVAAPANPMGIAGTTMHVAKNNGAVVTQSDVILPMAELKGVTLDVQFSNSTNASPSVPKICLYSVSTQDPHGTTRVEYFGGQGSKTPDGISLPLPNPLVPGKYVVVTQGTSQAPGIPYGERCLGNTVQNSFTLTGPALAAPVVNTIGADIIAKP